MMFKNTHQKGFTLIELSIVLVIVGLLVGGVIVGRDLVKNAKVRKQIKQIEQYQSAYNAFKLKYNCIPGDCLKATSFFSTATNGNGNTKIQMVPPYTELGINLSGGGWNLAAPELAQFFVQLSLSGLVSFNSDGTQVIGKGIPSMVLDKDSGFLASDSYSFSGYRVPDILPYKTGNNLLWMVACRDIGPADVFSLYSQDCGIFTPVDLKLIDTKLDNGLPLSGKFFGFSGDITAGYEDKECVNPGRTDYNLTNTGKWCQAAFVLD